MGERLKKLRQTIITLEAPHQEVSEDSRKALKELEKREDKVKDAIKQILLENEFCTGTQYIHPRTSRQPVPVSCQFTLRVKGEDLRLTSAKDRWGGPQLDKLGIKKQAIDFIFHTKEWKVRKVLTVPTEEHIESQSPQLLPDGKYPSDHFMIGADLELM